MKGPKPVPIEDRFWNKVVKGDGCWLWTGSHLASGYGRVSVSRRMTTAHRVAYELAKGPIPEGLHIDHLCRNRGCVNPDHLEAVTPGENVRRGDSGLHNSVKTHCKYGHEFTPENTYTPPVGGRYCRICGRQRTREWNNANR